MKLFLAGVGVGAAMTLLVADYFIKKQWIIIDRQRVVIESLGRELSNRESCGAALDQSRLFFLRQLEARNRACEL